MQYRAQPAFAAPLPAPPAAAPAARPAILPLAPKNAPASAPSSALVLAPQEAPAFAPTSQLSGTIIIPMDVISQNNGMWRAYGLVYRLLQRGVRVQWAIADNKTYNGIDFTANVRDLRTNAVVSTSYTYRGGPFIISAADRITATNIITTWWAANANQPAVHIAQADFSANVPVTLLRAPKIAQEEVNASITMAYFNAAGIPDSAGNTWSTSSPDIFDFPRIANGDLATLNQCRRTAYDVYVTPHNTGFDYDRANPNNVNTLAYARLMEFVRLGGGWTATCHSIQSMEDNMADITINGSPAVKALFTISSPITSTTQITGGMLTITGFRDIQNGGGTWVVNNSFADLPVAQFQPTTNPQALPGGSVQTWLFNPTNVRYWPGVERVAYFTTTAGLQYDHILNGSFQGGKGAGKVTFIGGHSFETSLPYLGNEEAPYLRAFFNSLLFNSAGKAQLDLIPSPTAIPQNITSTVRLSITNIGGSEATNLNDLRVFLEPGVQYASNTGPVPAVTSYPTGTLLVWTGIGTVAAGSTPIVITTNARGSILGENRIASIYTQFGDVFGEGFTANYCRSITVVPAPNPILNKTPSPQTVVAGRPVSWTLTYANTGTAVLSNALVVDTLPAGFQYVSASSTPAVGAPLVTPQPNGTTSLVWSIGTLVTSTVVTRTIVITATSPGISQGTQSFTNTASLNGNAVGGVPISSGLKSAIVNVIQPALVINKGVTPTEATPGSVLTYSIALTYTDPVPFTNAVLTDVIPANTTYVAGSANAGGTFITAANTLSWTLGSNVAGVPGVTSPSGGTFVSNTVAISDTYLDLDNTGDNYGNCTVFRIDSESSKLNRALLKFDLSGIPVTATILGATFVATATAVDSNTSVNYGAYRVTRAWTEGTGGCGGNAGQASWNQAASATNWTTAGGDFTTSGGTTTNVSTVGAYEWNMLTIVQDWVNNGQANHGFIISSTTTTGNEWKEFDSRTNTTTANRPRLIVSYTLPSIPATGVSMSSAPLLVSGNNQVTVTMVLTSAGTITNVVPPASLTVTGTNGAAATLSSGPTPSGNFTITVGTPVTLTYIYNVTPGTTPGSVTFGGAPASPSGAFVPARSNSTLVVPVLTFRVTVNTPLPLSVNQVANTATFRDTNAIPNGQTSPPALTTILQPLLEIIKETLATDPVRPGDRITYTLSVLNIGTGPANNAVLRDAVPVSTTYVAGSCAGGTSCSLIGSNVVFTSASIPAFSAAVFTFAVTVNPFSVVGTYPITNVARITSTEVVTPEISNVVTNTMLVDPNIVGVKSAVSSNLSPTLFSNSVVEPGDRITYTLVFTNNGPGVATNVIISDPIDSDTTVVTPVPDSGIVISASGATTVTWPAIPSLAVGAAVTRTFSVSVNLPTGDGDVILNKATVVADSMTPRDTNETSFIVSSQPVLTVTKGSIPPPGTVLTYGQRITYSLVITNIGNANTNSAKLVDPLPDGLAYITNSTFINGIPLTDFVAGVPPVSNMLVCSPGFCDPDGDAGTLVVGLAAVVTYQVQALHPITQGFVLTNVATVNSPATPDVSSNAVTHIVQFPVLTGVVTDVLSGLPIPGATVVFTDAAGTVFTATTGIDGRYTFTSTPSIPIAYGPGTVTGSAAGYVPVPFDSSITIVNGINTKDVPLTRIASLQISKAGPASAVPGQQVTYTIRITNTGPSTATNVTLRDPAPAGLTFSSASVPCTAGITPCNVGTLNVGDTALVTVTFNIGSAVTGTITNVASVTATEWLTPVVATVTTPLTPIANLQIVKQGPATVKPGQQVTYTIIATNTGPSAASVVTIIDQPVAGMSLTQVSPPCALGFPCVIPSGLAVGASVRLTVTFNVTSSVVGLITNTASITSPETPEPPTSTVTTTLTPEANLQIVKLGPATAVPGTKITYTLAITNIGPSNASVITITDPTPAGLISPSVSAPCAGGFPCVINTGLAVSASVRLTVTFDVLSGAAGVITNTATVTSPETPEPPTSTVTTTLTPEADLQITKTAPLTATPGNTISYQLVVFNAGPSDAPNATVSDTFPSQIAPASITWSCISSIAPCNNPSGSVTLNVTENISAGERLTYTLTGTVNSAATGIITNTATVTPSAGITDPVTGNNISTVPTTLAPLANLQIKKLGPATVVPGTKITYTIAVTNAGPSAASVITITDPTPAGLSNPQVTGPCSSFDCVISTGLAVSQSVLLTVTFDVNPDAVGVITNTASVTSPETPEPPTSTVTTTLTPDAVLQIKKLGPSTAVPGTQITYTIAVTNTGPSAATNVTVTDDLPAALTNVSISGACAGFPCFLGTLNVNQSVLITVTGTITQSAVGTITNTATVTSPVTLDPPTSTVPTTLTPLANLEIKKLGPATTVPGTKITYTIAVTNIGPSNASVITITDPTPAGLSNPQATAPCASGFPCVISTGLAVSASVRLTVTFDVVTTAVGVITNTASVTSPETPEPPTSTVPTTLTPQADIGVRKTAPVTATPGNQITYTILVTNAGPSFANNVSVSDTFNSVLSGITWSCLANAGSACNDAGGAGNISTTVNLTVGGQVTLFITGTIAPTATGLLPNTVVITSPIDTTPDNTSTVTTTLEPSADLSIVKVGPPDVIAGTALVYTLTVTNGGPSQASQITVTDETPAGLTFVAFGGACSGASCTLPSLAVGQQAVVIVTFTVPADYTGTNPITNTAVVSASTFDPNLDNNTSTVTTPATEQADLVISKQAITGTAVPGRTITFTVVVTNLGPTNAKAVSVIDPQPAGLTFVSNAGDCTTPFPCNLNTVPFGQTRVITSVYNVLPGFTGPTATNIVTVTSTTPDPVTSNNVDSETVNIAPSADVSITKLAPPAIVPGTTAVFTINVTNLGPSNAQSVTVNDPTPAGLTFAGNSGDCTSPFPCAFASLQAGESRQIVVTFNVPAGYSGSTVTNTATVTSTTPDPVITNNSSTVTAPVTPNADLSITKTDDRVSASPGTSTTYTVVVQNAGPSNAADAVVSDTLPSAILTVTWSCTASNGACASSGSGNINDTVSISAGGRLTYVINGFISAAATGILTNVASVMPPAGITDPVTSNNVASDTTTLAPNAVLQIKKLGPSTAVPGTQITYTIAVTNTGPSAATNVTVTDNLPAELTNVSISGACTSFACTLGTLGVNESVLITVTGTITNSAVGTITNTATVTSPVTLDPPTSTVPTTLTPNAVLQIKKLGPSTAVPGTQITYTIAVTNVGPSAATNVTVTDDLPAELTNVSITGACTSFACTLGTLGVNESRLITVTGTITQSAVGVITNTAGVTSPVTLDPPTSTVPTTLTPLANLEIKKLGPATTVPGAKITYTIAVTNVGPSNASVITITDPTPAGLSNPVVSAPCASGFACVISTGLAVGASVRLTVTFDVNPDAVGVITNTASVTSPETPEPPTSTVPTTLTPQADLQITKTGPLTDTPGTSISYQLVVFNAGPSDAPNATVSDTFPSQLAAGSIGWTCISSIGNCNNPAGSALNVVEDILAGERMTYTINAQIATTATGVMTNTAVVVPPLTVTDPVTSNNTSLVPTTLTPLANLEIKKLGPATATPGTQITYTIAVTNAGPSNATIITITDPAPAGLSNPIFSGPCTGATCVIPTGLAVNASLVVTVSFSVNADAVGVITNTASVTSPETPEPPTSTVPTTLTPNAVLQIKKLGPSTAVPGTQITYTIAVTNTGPSAATNVTVTDNLPAELTNVSITGACTSFIACNLGTLQVNQSVLITVTGTITQSAVGTITNTAAVTSPVSPDAPTSTVPTTLTPNAVLQIKKLGPATAVPGTQITYTIAVTNTGPSAATNVTVTDNLPAELTNVSISGACTSFIACNLGTLGVNESRRITVTATVNALALGTITNTAAVTSPVSPDAPTSTVPTTLAPLANLEIKKLGPATVVPGNRITYTIAVTNAGPSAASVVTITDPTPAGLSNPQVSGACGVLPCVINGGLAVGASAQITVSFDVAANVVGVITNTATVTSPETPEPPTSTVTTTATPQADVGVLKTGPVTATPGTSIAYTVVVTNAGPSIATNVAVTDTLPAGVTSASWQCVAGVGSSCASNSGFGNINTTVNLTVGGAITFTLNGTVLASATGQLVNTAVITTPADTTPDNNTSTVTTTLVTSATITILKLGPSTAVPGTQITYTISVANAGPSDAPDAVLNDPTPAGLTFASATPPCAAGFPCSLGTVPAKSSVLITLTFNVIATATGQVVNTASVTTPVIPEPPTTMVTTTLTPLADLSVEKSVRNSRIVTAGGSVSYAIVVRNAGPSAVTDAPVNDALPAELTQGFWSCIASAGGSCQPTPGSGNINATVSLLPGGVATFTLDATISAQAAGTITNTATVTVPQGVTDTNPLNNTSSVTVTVAKSAFLGIFKTNDQSVSVPGTQVTYTIVVSNAGPSDASNITINDTFPAELQSPTWTCAGVNGAACPASGSGNINTLVSLPANSTLTFTVKATVALNATGLLTNTANVQTPPEVVNTNPVTRSTDVDTLTPAVVTGRVFNDVNGNAALDAGEPGLSGVQIVITPSTGTPFVVTVDNNGLFTATVPPGAYSFSVVPSTVPSGFALTTGNATQNGTAAPGVNPTTPIGYQGRGTVSGVVFEDLNQNGVFGGEPVFPGTVVTLTAANCVPSPSTALIAQSAEAVDASCTFTTTTGADGRYSFTNVPAGPYTVSVGARPDFNNSTPLTQSGTLAAGGTGTHDFGFFRPVGIVLNKVSETSLPNNVVGGDRLITFTVIATNTGGVTATNVVITDQLPAFTQLVEGSITPAPASLSPLTWQIGSLAPGQSVTVRFAVRMNEGFAGVVRNVAFVSSPEQPTTPSNETVNTVQPTAIRLASFTAERISAGVRIAWRTSSEVDTFGFHVLRSTTNNPDTATRVNAEPELGKGQQGGSYEVIDAQAEAGVTYYYWLEEIELYETRIVYTDWVARVAPLGDQNTRTFRVYVPALMR